MLSQLQKISEFEILILIWNTLVLVIPIINESLKGIKFYNPFILIG